MFCYVPHRQAAHPADTVMVERFQFGPVFFFQCPAFTSPKCYISDNRLVESATDMHGYLSVAEHLLVH
jgi:hypothetical protein